MKLYMEIIYKNTYKNRWRKRHKARRPEEPCLVYQSDDPLAKPGLLEQIGNFVVPGGTAAPQMSPRSRPGGLHFASRPEECVWLGPWIVSGKYLKGSWDYIPL